LLLGTDPKEKAMGIIEKYVGRYRKEYDFYDQAARLVAQLLEGSLQSAGIRAMVTFRAKSPIRLEAKVRQRSEEKGYTTVDDIYRDILDLTGVRVALYFPAEREQVGKLIRQLFILTEDPKEFPTKSKPSYQKRFSGYWATHYKVRLHDASLSEAQKRFAEALVEIQVASVLMHAWAEVEHDLVYKPMQGGLSDNEYSILDELNGLVMAGEIALERLQNAGETRVASTGRKFSNHYDLASYLLDKAAHFLKGTATKATLGRVDVLYSFLRKLDLTEPNKLEPYIQSLSGDTEQRALSEQIVDQLLAEDERRYKAYEETRSAIDSEVRNLREDDRLAQPGVQNAISKFLSKWITFERIIREVSQSKSKHPRLMLMTPRNIEQLGVISKKHIYEVDRIRHLRNNLVHGVEIPDARDIKEATKRLGEIVDVVLKSIAVTPNKARRKQRAPELKHNRKH
jgi:ppGpp synthetase/RelA/SpoT-type nucleotidyltranferase